MLRSAAAARILSQSGALLSQQSKRVVLNSRCVVIGSRASGRSLLRIPPTSSARFGSNHLRAFSSQGKQDQQEPPKKEDGEAKDEGEETKEIMMTPGEQVVAASRLGIWAIALGFACACAFYIVRELLPTKMSPNSVFNSAIKTIRNDPQVKRQYGEKLKMYGKDHGGHREGRRNFIEHTQYKSPDDDTNRTRVRFNLEGQFANAFCFAEVSSDMPSGEFVYVLVQDKQTGRVITVVDNRAAITAKRLAGGNKETSQAMQQLLGGSGKN